MDSKRKKIHETILDLQYTSHVAQILFSIPLYFQVQALQVFQVLKAQLEKVSQE